MPTMTLPEIKLPATELKVDLPKVDLPKVELSKLDLPAEIERRLPGRRRRPNPLPFVLLGLAVAALVTWLVTMSPLAPRVRRTIDDARVRLGMGNSLEDAALDELDDIENAVRPSSFSIAPDATPSVVRQEGQISTV